MDGTFPQFSRLPQELQDNIWEQSMKPTPCVQALGLYVLPHHSDFEDELDMNKQLAQNTELIKVMEQDSDELRFLLPDPEMARLSPYYRTLVQVAPACVAASEAYRRVVHRARSELSGLDALAPTPGGHDEWEVDENQTAVTIFALLTRPREEDKHRNVVPDLIMGSSGPHQIAPVFLNPNADILWLDCDFCPIHLQSEMSRSAHRLSELRIIGFYNRHLVPLRRIAIEFSQPKFGVQCPACLYLRDKRDRYQRWLDSWHKRSPDDYTVCLLCAAMERPELADLSAAQRQEAKKWITNSGARLNLDSGQETPGFPPSPGRVDISSIYEQGFHDAYPMLRRVHNAMQAIRREVENHPRDNQPEVLAVCPDNYDGNLADFYNQTILDPHFPNNQFYEPQAYDDETGEPVCGPAAAERGTRYFNPRHAPDYPGYTYAVAGFWPLTTPNLETLYVIDRGIKLRPGVVSIPAGATTFQGNGCVYVEVPEPSSSSSSQEGIVGGEVDDGVWRYPGEGPWGGDVFAFARHLRETMSGRREHILEHGVSHLGLDPMLRACTAEGVKSPHNRAIHSGGEVPEVKVLAIVEE